MCFYDQHIFACGDWKWAHFQQHCSREYRVGETCGMKLVMQTHKFARKCKLCEKLDIKHRRLRQVQEQLHQRGLIVGVNQLEYDNVTNYQLGASSSRRKHYIPLHYERREIRLFTLSPGEMRDPVRGTLSIVSLDPLLLSKSYEAVSYAWASQNILEPERFIIIDECSFKVQSNLESALPYLRRQNSPRTLWIDAICIDQGNISERNHQVSLMKRIYGSASNVLIWLGPIRSQEESSSSGMGMFRHLFEDGFSLKSARRCYDGEPVVRKGFADLLNRSWWQRMWVVQEVILSKRAELVCGPSSVKWPSTSTIPSVVARIELFKQSYLADLESPPRLDQLLTILRLQARRLQQSAPSLLEMVDLFHTRQCLDPRDRVFALLGLASDTEATENAADYSLSFEDVKIRLLQTSVARTGSLDFLHCSDGSTISSPSWMPDWGKKRVYVAWTQERRFGFALPSDKISTSRSFRATENTTPLPPKFLGALLTLPGFIIDSTQRPPIPLSTAASNAALLEIPDLKASRSTAEDLFSSWGSILLEWLKADSSLKVDGLIDAQILKDRETAVDTFWRTMVANPTSSLYDSPKTQRKPFHSVFEKALKNGTMSLFNPLLPDLEEALANILPIRTFFVSKGGHIGLAPRKAREGDLICFFLGARTPFVIREASGGQYKLVGECYVHGLMHGAAVRELEAGKYKMEDITLC